MARSVKSAQSSSDRQLELKYHLRSKLIDAVAGTLQVAIRYGVFLLVAYFIYLSVNRLAGRYTVADIGLRLLANLRISETLGWSTGLGGILYGWRQRKLRRDKTEYLQNRIKELESMLDPKRSSSRLTPRGTTNPEDKEGG